MSKAQKQLDSILIPGEVVEGKAVQVLVLALLGLHRRRMIVATNNRCIYIIRGLFGGFTPVTRRWQDIDGVYFKVGVLSAWLPVTWRFQTDLASTGDQKGDLWNELINKASKGLRKAEAEGVYRICQAQEQAWREKRRLREIEELRAQSGGMLLGSSPSGVGVGLSSHNEDDPIARLAVAKQMLDRNLVSDSEYQSIKTQILSRV